MTRISQMTVLPTTPRTEALTQMTEPIVVVLLTTTMKLKTRIQATAAQSLIDARATFKAVWELGSRSWAICRGMGGFTVTCTVRRGMLLRCSLPKYCSKMYNIASDGVILPGSFLRDELFPGSKFRDCLEENEHGGS